MPTKNGLQLKLGFTRALEMACAERGAQDRASKKARNRARRQRRKMK